MVCVVVVVAFLVGMVVVVVMVVRMVPFSKHRPSGPMLSISQNLRL